MIRAGQRASEIVGRLRALSRKADPVHVPLDIADAIDDAVLLMQQELQTHRVGLSVAPYGPLPSLRGDRVQLQQVVINLLMNGIQAMDGVTAKPRRLTIDVARSIDGENAKDCIVVTVADTGPGIAAADLNRLVDTFFTTKADGMGSRSAGQSFRRMAAASGRPAATVPGQASTSACRFRSNGPHDGRKSSPTRADAHSVDDRRRARSANRSERKMTAKSPTWRGWQKYRGCIPTGVSVANVCMCFGQTLG
jgi:light-regulated signal transduction histidine kinase (bacteriophytochrome)